METLLKLFVIISILSFASCNSKKRTTQEPQSSIEDEQYFDFLWHFSHNDDFASKFGIDREANIHIEEAWKVTKGAGVTVAVIDAGSFNDKHEDLKDNVINVYNADYQNGDVSNDTDEPSHGTTVSGFIAAPINGKGIVGAAPEAKLILIKQSLPSDAATIRAFQYAKDNGAQVINNSWGTNNVSQAVASFLQELKDDGITIIFASGNENCNMDENFIQDSEGNIICTQNIGIPINDESELSSVIGVGASNEKNDVTSYSNYGSEIDILAPGGDNSISSGILGLDDTGPLGSGVQRMIVSNNYAFASGTSFSAPITTGVVALMLSINPTLSPDRVRDILIQSADKIGDSANYNSSGFDRQRAFGKINASNALSLVN